MLPHFQVMTGRLAAAIIERIAQAGRDLMRLGLLVGLVGLSWPSWAYAHSESAAPVFVNGLIHPTLNATHLLALVAVGVFAGTSGAIAIPGCGRGFVRDPVTRSGNSPALPDRC